MVLFWIYVNLPQYFDGLGQDYSIPSAFAVLA